MILPLGINDSLFLSLGLALYLTHSTDCHILVIAPLKNTSLLILLGQVSTQMFVAGPVHVYSVNLLRYRDIPIDHHPHSLLPMLVLTLYISTSLDPSHHPMVSHIFSHVWTVDISNLPLRPNPTLMHG